MAIYSNCEFDFQDSELIGAWIDFSFDQYFTMDMINSYDVDKNNSFDKSETEMIYNHAFINLKNYGFFISIRNKDGRFSPDRVDNFSVFLKEGKITYRFYINLPPLVERELYFSVYDPTFFCACYYNETDPVSVSGASSLETEYKIVKNTDFPIYYDPYASASNTTTYDKWEQGLQTFYPEEIHFVY
jgi:ABC-type uncharacterized transport system substrate-binding protein